MGELHLDAVVIGLTSKPKPNKKKERRLGKEKTKKGPWPFGYHYIIPLHKRGL